MEKKVTKRENFEAIIAVLNEAGREDLAKVVAHEIELLDNKAAKAKAKAAEKKTEGDALRNAVQAVLTDELATIKEITEKAECEDITSAKVQFRLNALVNAGIARKEQITVGEGESKRKLMSYRLAD
jgi:predicted Rossmann fold nucleotide-binding protein DprA/Smf involved in DNA uptake